MFLVISAQKCATDLACSPKLKHEETNPAAMKRDEQQVNDHIWNKITDHLTLPYIPRLLLIFQQGC